nr:DNA-directed RNA polymerase III subunit 1-like isoform X1 [Ipomoea batatas]
MGNVFAPTAGGLSTGSPPPGGIRTTFIDCAALSSDATSEGVAMQVPTTTAVSLTIESELRSLVADIDDYEIGYQQMKSRLARAMAWLWDVMDREETVVDNVSILSNCNSKALTDFCKALMADSVFKSAKRLSEHDMTPDGFCESLKEFIENSCVASLEKTRKDLKLDGEHNAMEDLDALEISSLDLRGNSRKHTSTGALCRTKKAANFRMFTNMVRAFVKKILCLRVSILFKEGFQNTLVLQKVDNCASSSYQVDPMLHRVSFRPTAFRSGSYMLLAMVATSWLNGEPHLSDNVFSNLADQSFESTSSMTESCIVEKKSFWVDQKRESLGVEGKPVFSLLDSWLPQLLEAALGFSRIGSAMEAEAVPPPISDGGPIGRAEGGTRTFKRFKQLKRSFVEVAADCPSFEGEAQVQCDEGVNWFEEDIVIDSDKEDEPVEREDGIPIVRFSKKVREDLIKPWRNALLVKYLGKPVAFPLFQQRML